MKSDLPNNNADFLLWAIKVANGKMEENNKEELKNSTNGNTTIEGSGESVVEKDENEGQSATVVMIQVPNQEESKNVKVEEEKPLQNNNNNFQNNSITHSLVCFLFLLFKILYLQNTTNIQGRPRNREKTFINEPKALLKIYFHSGI